MSVKKEPGRHSVAVETEVPGTPEEVWKAIATGPGVTAWFVPSDVEERDGRKVFICHFGPGMDSVATVTEWDPPRRFVAIGKEFVPGGPDNATEWIVEARGGGTCVVRVVHSLFTDRDDWDDQLEDVESGWPTFFAVLRIYLDHFRGQRCTQISHMSFASGSRAEAWKKLIGSLGLEGATVGERRTAAEGAPPLSGIVERTGSAKHPEGIILRIDTPAPGTFLMGAHEMGGQICAVLTLYLYGDEGATAAAREEAGWRAWLDGVYSSPGSALKTL